MNELIGLTEYPVARRGMMGGLIAGFTLATTVVQAQAIRTDATGLVAGPVTVPTTEGVLPGYRAKPAGPGPFPVV